MFGVESVTTVEESYRVVHERIVRLGRFTNYISVTGKDNIDYQIYLSELSLAKHGTKFKFLKQFKPDGVLTVAYIATSKELLKIEPITFKSSMDGDEFSCDIYEAIELVDITKVFEPKDDMSFKNQLLNLLKFREKVSTKLSTKERLGKIEFEGNID